MARGHWGPQSGTALTGGWLGGWLTVHDQLGVYFYHLLYTHGGAGGGGGGN